MSQVSLTRETMDANFPSAVCPQELRDRADAFLAAKSSNGKRYKMSALIRVAMDFYLRHHSTDSGEIDTESGYSDDDLDEGEVANE